MGTQISQPTYNECRKIITRVFKKLRLKGNGGFCAKQNFGWCRSEGWWLLEQLLGDRYDSTPCVWYHWQANENLKREREVYLAWGDTEEHARTICRLFEEEQGVTVEWDGTKNKCIKLKFGDS